MKKINISISEDLLECIDSHCEKNNVSRSAFISQASTEKLQTIKFYALNDELCEAIRRIGNSNDEDAIRKIDILTKAISIIKPEK